jgi:heptose-I-phosphate ethanolaminephosphotransferase
MAYVHREGTLSIIYQAAVRAAITCSGLVVFWQLGMQDLQSLGKAAAFTVIANLGLAGLSLLLPASMRRLAGRAALALNALVLLTAAVEGFLFWLYDLTPKHLVVADAILGSNPDEAREFVVHYWQHLLLAAALPASLTALLAWAERRLGRSPHAHAAPTRGHGRWLGAVVLVLGESVNRANWSLYGYGRATTPGLDARRGELLVFRNVRSSDAATVQSLLKMLTPATLEAPDAWHDQPNVLALARRAGYRVYWLSNQEQADGPIQILAEYAHEQLFVNSGRGREARSLDERLLPQLDRILAAPAPRKLVVVHMQGAHLRYDLRYPPAFDRFSNLDDGVAAGLIAAGRPYWIRQARNQYDNAMLYGDHVLSGILDRVRRGAGARPSSLLFVSDHGQEVGHHRDFAGHSSRDPSGYQVPLLLWTSRADKLAGGRAALEARAYRTDNLDHTLVGLLDIRTKGYRPEYDLLSERFGLRLARD